MGKDSQTSYGPRAQLPDVPRFPIARPVTSSVSRIRYVTARTYVSYDVVRTTTRRAGIDIALKIRRPCEISEGRERERESNGRERVMYAGESFPTIRDVGCTSKYRMLLF